MADPEIKRDYELLPDNRIRFGIRSINSSDTAISEVKIILDYSHSLFELEGNKIVELGTIPPSTSRTTKFILKPLGCIHKEEIGATVLYRDSKWEKHSFDMHPKEVHCICPFLKEKLITRYDFLELSNKGYSVEYGVNFENISIEILVEFLSHTCKNRLYKVDEFSIENGKVLYLAGDSLGDKAYYLLTAVVVEREGVIQVLLHTSSDKPFGIYGFLNEIFKNLRHLVRSISSAREIGIIKNEQVINIINSVVQHTNFSGEIDASSVNIQGSVVQRTNFGHLKNEKEEKEAEKKLHKQQNEKEQLNDEKQELERLQKQKEEGMCLKKTEEEMLRRKKEEKSESKEREEEEKYRKQTEGQERTISTSTSFKSKDIPEKFSISSKTNKKDVFSNKRNLIVYFVFGLLLIIATGTLIYPNFHSDSQKVTVEPNASSTTVEPNASSTTIYAYITNWNSNTVSVIDTATNTVTATVDVEVSPSGVAVNPAGTRVYVANSDSNSVSVIDTATNNVIANVTVGNTPYGVAVNPAGTKVYVTNRYSNTTSIIDTATNTVIANVIVGYDPYGVAVSPDGEKVYVTNSGDGSNTISVMDTATNTVTATVDVGDHPFGAVINPAGTKLYITNFGGNTVSVIDTATNIIRSTVKTGKSVNGNPYGVAINPAGTKAYIANHWDNTVSVVDIATNTVISTVKVGNAPIGVAINPAGTKVYVANWDSNSVSVIDTATNTVTATVNVGDNPIAFGQFIGALQR